MRIAFFGTPEFAWNILSWILSLNPSPREGSGSIECCLVVSQPDKAVWRKKELVATPVKQIALDAGIDVLQPDKIKKNIEFFENLRDLNLDFIVVVAYGKIIPQALLDIPKYGCINLHGSILPEYRGASPVQAAVKSGETETGLTTMYMSKGMDEGDILKIQKVPVEPDDTSQDIFRKFSEVWPKLLLETLEWVLSWELEWTPQDKSLAMYCGKIAREDGEVLFRQQSHQEIYNTYRAYTPWPGIYTWYEGKRLVLEEVKAFPLTQHLSQFSPARRDETQIEASFPSEGKEFKIEVFWGGLPNSWSFLKLTKNRYGIVCSDGEILEILRVKLEGKKSMDVQSFVNGNREVLEYVFL